MRIEQIMSQPVTSCGPGDSLHSVARLMWEHDCGAVPVVDGDGKLIGIITDRDICMATYIQGEAPQAISVSAAMSNIVFSCHPDDSLETAERVMSDKQVRRLPVVKDGRPIGMLSLNDLARHGASSRKNGALEHEVVQTMAAICAPRQGALEQVHAS